MNETKNAISCRGYGLWEVVVYKNGGEDSSRQPPAVEGFLYIDSGKYYVVEEDESTSVEGITLLVVPSGNVAYALNRMDDEA